MHLSTPDLRWHQPDFPIDPLHPLRNHPSAAPHENLGFTQAPGTSTLELPFQQPDVVVPVVELFFKN